MTNLLLESTQEPASLKLSPYDNLQFIAALSSPGLAVTSAVSSYLSHGIGEFMADLAKDWKGWSGAKEWSSLEGELSLRATSDRLGHVSVNVHLHRGAPEAWSVECPLVLEAGQLQRLAQDAKMFEAAVYGTQQAVQRDGPASGGSAR